MKKFILLLCLFCCGCSGKYFQYQNDLLPPTTPPKFSLRNVEIHFSEQKIKPLRKDSLESQYLTKEQMVFLTRQEIINQLKEDNLYSENSDSANVLECDFEMEYVRKFMMFTNKSYVGTVMNGYKINIYQNGKLIASKDDDNNIYFLTQGFTKNFNKLKKIFTFKYNEQDEQEEIKALARLLAKNLEKFGN